MINLNLLIDEWEDPTRDLYLKEVEVLTSGICLQYIEREKFKKIIRSLFYIENSMIRRSLMDELHGYMNLNICSDEMIHLDLYSKDSFLKIHSETNTFKSIDEFIQHILEVPSKNGFKDNEVLIKIYITKGKKRLELELKESFINSNEFFKKHILNKMPEKLSETGQSIFKKYLNSKNLFELTTFLDNYNQNSEEFEMTDKLILELDLLVQNKLIEIYNSMKIKKEYLEELKNSTLILDTSCIS